MRSPSDRHLRVARPAVAVAALALVPLAVIAPAHAADQFIDDATNDVVVTGGDMSTAAYRSADMDEANMVTSTSEVEWRLEMWDNAPAPDATVTYQVKSTVAHKKPKNKKKKTPKPYTVTVEVISNDPIDPIRVYSTKSGTSQRVSCEEATTRVAGSYDLYIAVPRPCIGGKTVATLLSKVLVTSVDAASGARGQDGLAFKKMAF